MLLIPFAEIEFVLLYGYPRKINWNKNYEYVYITLYYILRMGVCEDSQSVSYNV